MVARRNVPLGSASRALFAALVAWAAPYAEAQASFTARHVQAGGSFLWGIAAGPAGLVAVGTGGTILTSTDGAAWVRRASGTTDWLVGVAYGNGQYVVVGDNGTILLSPDGSEWLGAAQSATTQRLNNVVYGAGQFVAVGEAGTIVTSPDGTHWTARISGLPGWLRGLTHVDEFIFNGAIPPNQVLGPARFVTSGQDGIVISSPDGVTWANDSASYGEASAPVGGALEALATVQSVNYAGVGEDGLVLASFWGTFFEKGSELGTASEYLNLSSVPDPVYLRGLVACAGVLYATGDNGTILTASTSDYVGNFYPSSWSTVSSGTNDDLVAGVAIGDSVYLVGSDETILGSTVPADSRLTNLSCRSQVGTGGDILIAGFVVAGNGAGGTLPLLVRASGPALEAFGVAGTLADPELQLYSTASGSSLLAANSSWGGGTALSGEASEVGAFAWADAASHDAALSETLSAGPYTANITGESGDTGIALAEIYDATDPTSIGDSSPRLVNLSARARASSGGGTLIAGFVIGGSTPKTVLIRASGPALLPFGVAGTLADPALQVYSTAGAGAALASNPGWGGDPLIATAAAWVGAFSWGLSPTSDSALLITLPPGPYTANVTGASGDSGVALIEVYEVR